MKYTAILFLTFVVAWPTSAKLNDSIILSSSIAKSQLEALVNPRLEWAISNNDYRVTNFTRDWTPVKSDTVSLYQQSRQVFVFLKVYELNNDRRYLDAAIKSADYMIQNMYDSLTGKWTATVKKDAPKLSTTSKSYDTSFALFAMAHMFRVTKEKQYLDIALKTWMLSYAWPGLNFAKGQFDNRPGKIGSNNVWSQNPLMHLFEALLVLYEVTESQQVFSDIKDIAAFIRDKLIDGRGYLAEYYYTDDFSPIAQSEGGYIEIGHQFEWSALMLSAVRMGLDDSFRELSKILFEYGQKFGVDSSTGHVISRVDYAGLTTDSKAKWWSQAEYMKANLLMMGFFPNEQSRFQENFAMNYGYVLNHFIDQDNGGWVDENFKSNIPEKSKKVIGYHAVEFYSKLIEGVFKGRVL